MSNIIDKSSSLRSTRAPIVTDKNSREYRENYRYGYGNGYENGYGNGYGDKWIGDNREFYLSGPREACEDITCRNCNSYIKNGDWDNYKKCKQDCFYEKKDEIFACCIRSCDHLKGKALKSCLDACENELKFF